MLKIPVLLGGRVFEDQNLRKRFESELHDYLGRNTQVLTKLRDSNVLSDDIVDELDGAVDAFKKEFQTGAGKPLNGPGSEQFTELPAEDVNQEKIVKGRR